MGVLVLVNKFRADSTLVYWVCSQYRREYAQYSGEKHANVSIATVKPLRGHPDLFCLERPRIVAPWKDRRRDLLAQKLAERYPSLANRLISFC